MSLVLFFFKQKTAYELRISDWSSDVCSSDLFVLQKGDQLTGLLGSCLEFDTGVDVLGVFAKDHHIRFFGLTHGRRHALEVAHRAQANEIGRAECRERVCQYV